MLLHYFLFWVTWSAFVILQACRMCVGSFSPRNVLCDSFFEDLFSRVLFQGLGSKQYQLSFHQLWYMMFHSTLVDFSTLPISVYVRGKGSSFVQIKTISWTVSLFWTLNPVKPTWSKAPSTNIAGLKFQCFTVHFSIQ